MRKIIVSAFVSLDGVMQAPGGPEEDTEGGFSYGGWTVGYWDDVVSEAMGKEMSEPFDGLLGRKTYEIMAAHWPNVEEEGADVLNNSKKYVISTSLDTVEWNNSELIKENIVEELLKLKEAEGPDIQVTGSSKLIQTLLENDLVDEFRLKIYPVILGDGKRLFGNGAIPAGLKLIDSSTSPSGVIIASYKRDGEIKVGSFTLD